LNVALLISLVCSYSNLYRIPSTFLLQNKSSLTGRGCSLPFSIQLAVQMEKAPL